ncbi:hypothetical protein BJV77DRAFT_722841 [Russula vinacea]|nr:hypothetical protein BJV77DRAFT_722841 [Russula vinacea]
MRGDPHMNCRAQNTPKSALAKKLATSLAGISDAVSRSFPPSLPQLPQVTSAATTATASPTPRAQFTSPTTALPPLNLPPPPCARHRRTLPNTGHSWLRRVPLLIYNYAYAALEARLSRTFRSTATLFFKLRLRRERRTRTLTSSRAVCAAIGRCPAPRRGHPCLGA